MNEWYVIQFAFELLSILFCKSKPYFLWNNILILLFLLKNLAVYPNITLTLCWKNKLGMSIELIAPTDSKW